MARLQRALARAIRAICRADTLTVVTVALVVFLVLTLFVLPVLLGGGGDCSTCGAE